LTQAGGEGTSCQNRPECLPGWGQDLPPIRPRSPARPPAAPAPKGPDVGPISILYWLRGLLEGSNQEEIQRKLRQDEEVNRRIIDEYDEYKKKYPIEDPDEPDLPRDDPPTSDNPRVEPPVSQMPIQEEARDIAPLHAAPKSWEDRFMPPGYRIDMRRAPKASKRTAGGRGYPRNKDYFWDEMLERHPHVFSPHNRRFVEQGLAPEVDKTWLKYFRLHELFEGDVIVHHHVGRGPIAAPIPGRFHQIFHSGLHYNPQLREHVGR